MNTIEDIEKLNYNWNGNGANPITQKVIDNTKNLIKYITFDYEMFPVANNTIQLEFSNTDDYMEIEISEEQYCLWFEKDNLNIYIDVHDVYKVINYIKIFHKKIKKATVFSGSFNPPTIAHNYMISKIIKDTNSNYVIFALSNDKFLKKKQSRKKDFFFNENLRLNMMLEMTYKNNNALIYGIEKGCTYEVLCDIRKIFNINDIFFACGDDKLKEIQKWKYSDKLLKEFSFYVLQRETEYIKIKEQCKILFNEYKIGVNDKYNNVSATLVRKLYSENKNFEKYVHPNVYTYLINMLKSL